MAKIYKTITEDRDFHKGDIVQHFKRETIVNTEPDSNGRYLYAIQGFATHTEQVKDWLYIHLFAVTKTI